MYNRLRELVLFLARVPAAPQPPEGAPNSLRVFRAARNQFRLRLLGWAVAQTFTAIGIVISIGFIGQVKHQMGEVADERARPASIEESVQPLQQDLAQKQGGP
ncbi:MAG TPA: hypothetical protein VHF69_04190, partial [Candidatus Synoicihabitans sp.]|nr:hypothetical protein [Candidatus Synoicihabitans sp.]